tara:strand:- start:545 stop:730 length:186 start_codon:yes stop_codon:yes gene_type:complete
MPTSSIITNRILGGDGCGRWLSDESQPASKDVSVISEQAISDTAAALDMGMIPVIIEQARL